MRSLVSCRVVYLFLRYLPELRARGLGHDEILQTGDDPGLAVGSATLHRDNGGAGLPAVADEGVIVRRTVDRDAIPGVLLDLDPGAGGLWV